MNRLLLVPADEFWDDLAHLAAELVRDDLDGAAVRVEQLRIGAHVRVSSIDDSLLQQLIQASVAESAALIGHDVVAMDCPVCGAVATVKGELVDEGEPYYEFEDGVEVPYWAYKLNVIVDRFVCRVCGFSLTGEDELKAGGIPMKVTNPEASPGDLHEPDFDRD